MTLGVGLEHVADLYALERLFGIFRCQVANPVRFDPLQHVTTKMLSVNLPIRFEVLPRGHEETRMTARVALLKVGLCLR